ncbi:penicillin-binding transpeptidase domain-containing protein [Cellulomonas marina]|uniref:Beta-lactamase n=1 Tax=Cellulomonas marina TaxID=988821 RepID=A0A1I0WWM3_9CELL|nr:penicillin-binding transpeptidase domain-containing protein [Cellulomonas marina]GIG30361.1 cell division protein FtsI [Cellulomonas marina]SFA92446.1 Cell division protein FtsI/penicillin-binding protein 2 [Cellulomonas marina]
MEQGRPTVVRRALALTVVGALVALLGACSPDRPAPDAAAQALADALSTGTFDDVVLAEGTDTSTDTATAAAQRAAVSAGLGDRDPQVAVAEVTPSADDEDAATARLTVTWDLGAAEPWVYTSTAQLTRGTGDEDPWAVRWAPSLLVPDLVEGETVALVRETPERADVLGADDAVLVEDRPVERLGIDKTLGDAAALDADARTLATSLGLDPDAYAAQVAAAGPKAFVQAIVVRQGDPAYDVAALTTPRTSRAVADSIPLAPTRTFARAVLGTVGEATAEVVEASGGTVVAGDLAGLSGLQERYDAQLRGTPGLVVRATSADGTAERELFRADPVPGTPLRTTIDPDLQTLAESVLADVTPASALVALRPSTGDVLAVAAGPGSGGFSTATLGQYPPGSTFKVASALALLRTGATPDTVLACPATTTVEGRTFRNYPDYPASALGDIPLRTAFAQSCNTAFLGAAAQVPQASLAEAAGALGLGTGGDLGFDAFLAAVPAEATGTDHAASLIGQGRVLASPLGMATVAASVAAGTTVVPRLVVPGPEGLSGDAERPVPSTAPPLTPDEASTLAGLMRAVVTEGGAGVLAAVPGEPVGAKTGTAQFGEGEALQNHAWMIAIQGDLAVAVFVEVGDYGSTTAGPLMASFLTSAAGL